MQTKLIHDVRAVKNKRELTSIVAAQRISEKVLLETLKKLRTGITELQVEALIKKSFIKHGAPILSFPPIVAFGKNSAYPHYRAGNQKLKKGDVVLVDIGVVVDKYHSDMTRTFFFGKADPRLIVLDSVVKKAHAAALAVCKKGAKVGDLDEAARKVIQAAGLENLILHSLGHGIGLETHEFPRLKYQGEDHEAVLSEGMVITIEPGLYLPGVGGIRHEDTIVITQKGYENFYV